MKRILKHDMEKITDIEPQNCVIIRIFTGDDVIWFQVLKSLCKDENGKIGIKEYKDCITGVSELRHRYKTKNFWKYMNAKSPFVAADTTYPEDAVEQFMTCQENADIKPISFYAITATEFGELIPLLRDGTYGFFIERRFD